MSTQTRLPPLATSGVFAVQSSALINAPRQKVWDTLLDFARYNEWNSFVRSQNLVDKTGAALANQTTIQEGQLASISAHIPPTMGKASVFQKQGTTVLVTYFDDNSFRVAWEQRGIPTWLLSTERWQILVEEGAQTRYETIEVFKGPLAYIVKLFVRAGLVKSFQAMALDLKARVEQS